MLAECADDARGRFMAGAATQRQGPVGVPGLGGGSARSTSGAVHTALRSVSEESEWGTLDGAPPATQRQGPPGVPGLGGGSARFTRGAVHTALRFVAEESEWGSLDGAPPAQVRGRSSAGSGVYIADHVLGSFVHTNV